MLDTVSIAVRRLLLLLLTVTFVAKIAGFLVDDQTNVEQISAGVSWLVLTALHALCSRTSTLVLLYPAVVLLPSVMYSAVLMHHMTLTLFFFPQPTVSGQCLLSCFHYLFEHFCLLLPQLLVWQ